MSHIVPFLFSATFLAFMGPVTLIASVLLAQVLWSMWYVETFNRDGQAWPVWRPRLMALVSVCLSVCTLCLAASSATGGFPPQSLIWTLVFVLGALYTKLARDW